MIENFLRRPHGLGEYAADAVRVLGALSVLAAAFWGTPTDAGVVAVTLPALVAPRFLGVRAWFDLVASLTILVAAWSNVFDLYTSLTGWDLVVHFACTAVLAILVYLLCARVGIAPEPGTATFTPQAAVVLTASFGLALSALWEMVEWVGATFITDAIFVTYTDTIGDMVLGGLGALAAGLVLARVGVLRT